MLYMLQLDTEVEHAIKSDSELTLEGGRDFKSGGYVIYISDSQGNEYSINENRRVQYNSARTIYDGNGPVSNILGVIKEHTPK